MDGSESSSQASDFQSRRSTGGCRNCGGQFGVLFVTNLFMCLVLGCGSGDPVPAPRTDQEARGPAEQRATLPAQLTAVSPQPTGGHSAVDNPALSEPAIDIADLLKPDPDNPLVGSWLGAATLDRSILEQKMAKVDADQQARLLKMARIFLTYQVAMDFYSDGRLGMVVQFAMDDREQLVSATGTWKVVQRDTESMIVELVEQIEGQAANTSQVRIMIHPDGQRIARPAELDPQLAVCEPMFIFNRIPEDFMQQMEIAQQPEVQTSEVQTLR